MMQLVVLSCVLAAASATGVFGVAPWAPYAYTAPVHNYRGPLSLAPGQPANVLGWDGRPLDTLDVNLDRSAHIIAKTYAGHVLKKRSIVPVVAPVTGHVTAPLIAPTLPLTYGTAHLSPYTYPYTTLTHYGRIASPFVAHW